MSSTVHADSQCSLALSQAKDTNQAFSASGVIVGFFARSRSVIKCRKRAIGHRSLDAALHLSDDARQVFVPRQRTMASPDSRAASLPATPGLPVRSATATEPSVLQSPLRSSPTRPLRRHPAMMPLLVRINHKRGIRQQITRSMISLPWNRGSSRCSFVWGTSLSWGLWASTARAICGPLGHDERSRGVSRRIGNIKTDGQRLPGHPIPVCGSPLDSRRSQLPASFCRASSASARGMAARSTDTATIRATFVPVGPRYPTFLAMRVV